MYGVIYKVQNKINNKVYIGQTINQGGFDYRYNGDLEKYTHNEHLKSSIKKYGIENFEIDKEFDIAYSQEELNDKEIYWIGYYNTTNPKFGYNKREGGEGGLLNEESKVKISETKQVNRENILKSLLNKMKTNGKGKFYGFEDIDKENDIINIPIDILLENDEKLLLTYIYLYINTNKFNESIFSLEDLIIECGYKPNACKGKSNELFRNTLKIMNDKKYFNFEANISEIKINKLYRCKINNDFTNIIKVHYKNILTIRNLKIKENNNIIIRAYIYLLYYANSISNITTGIINISNIMNIGENTLSRYISILEDNKLIFSTDVEYIKTSLGTIRGGTCYVTNKENLEIIKNNIQYIEL